MGLGPAAMQEDDIVIILYGGRTPFVLRQSGQQYYFLGEGFVEDLMRGEAFEQPLEGTFEEKTFELR